MKCLYYPYSRAVDLNTLKKATLLFDEIAFIDTKPQFIRNEIMSGVVSEKDYKEELEIAYSYLEKEGVVSIINPGKIVNDYDSLLTMNTIRDISDDEFCKLAIRYNTSIWDVFRDRIPPSFLKKFYPGCGTFMEAVALQNKIKSGNLDCASEKTYGRWDKISEERAWKLFSRYKFVIGGNPHIELESYKLPFLQASSLRMNEALLISAINNYIPFTDSKIHDRLLVQKVKLAFEQIENNLDLREYLDFKLPINLPQQHLNFAVLEKLIPEDELKKRSFEELVSYRRENQEKLRRLRDRIAEISSAIDITKVNSNYYLELQRIIDSKIVPEITKVRDELTTKYEESFGKLAIRSLQVTVPTLTATMFAGLSLSQILVACAIAEMGMVTTTGINEITKIWQTTKETNRTSYSYFTDI
ncbi:MULTISPECIES: hypothetical protein [Clostridium]|uniref:hypothetical protein n=1 Tax=Clostridium TaxID=1485 RepID=UPI002579CD0C|nr:MULTISPECIES: hypothetical protein [Clostridium]MBS4842899.1 hypothetical protein [Clostridium sp.]MDU1403983.1 hypothetical protein [Clostridium sp.]MDU1601820.1 hypothetical protein [Clostridium sp.]MDU2896898.1 hypothetical protein [Clostridium sp.]MDU3006000.1 hypothetical protein [Clostridium sp.]